MDSALRFYRHQRHRANACGGGAGQTRRRLVWTHRPTTNGTVRAGRKILARCLALQPVLEVCVPLRKADGMFAGHDSRVCRFGNQTPARWCFVIFPVNIFGARAVDIFAQVLVGLRWAHPDTTAGARLAEPRSDAFGLSSLCRDAPVRGVERCLRLAPGRFNSKLVR